eukprot:3025056-Prymnesium_polylepis.1
MELLLLSTSLAVQCAQAVVDSNYTFAMFTLCDVGTGGSQTTMWAWGMTMYAYDTAMADANAELEAANKTFRYNAYYYDVACRQNIGFQAATAAHQSTPKPSGFIGAGCSSATKSVALVGGVYQYPQVGYGTSTELADRNAYPYFNRAMTRDDFLIKALLGYVNATGWYRAAVIYPQTGWGK